MQCVAVCCSVLQLIAACCSAPHSGRTTATTLHITQYLNTMCCSVLQCVAVCCSVLQCVAVLLGLVALLQWRCASRSIIKQCVAVFWSALQCVAICCNVLQPERVAVRHSVLHCVAVLRPLVATAMILHITQYFNAVRRCVLPWFAVCCSVLPSECVAVYCSALQCVAVLRTLGALLCILELDRSDLLCYLQNDSFREFLFHLQKDSFHFAHTCSCVSWLIQTYDLPPSCVEQFMSDMTYPLHPMLFIHDSDILFSYS